MNTSLFELFKIGIGPSSSHTVGPMRAALRFVHELQSSEAFPLTARVQVDLFGSLALTGIGHGTDRAILLGLSGHAPDTVDPAHIESILTRSAPTTSLSRRRHARQFPFTSPPTSSSIATRCTLTPPTRHIPTASPLRAFDNDAAIIATNTFYSIGGGFILSDSEFKAEHNAENKTASTRTVPYPFRSSAELLSTAATHNLTIPDLLLANEVALLADTTLKINRPQPTASAELSPEDQIKASILALWQVMQSCTARGIATEGILPGGLNVRRRAHRLAERLNTIGSKDPLAPIDWVTVYAMAVNEENAAGGRVVTAPTNGAAGVIPAIAHYYTRFVAEAPDTGSPRKRPRQASSATSSPPPPSASSTKKTPASPEPR